MANKPLVMATAAETEGISRGIFRWLNQWPDKPTAIAYESLPADAEGMALSTIQGAYKTKTFVRGGYIGQYQCKIIYRLQPGSSNNNRLRADETLDSLGDWMTYHRPLPEIGQGKRAVKFEINSLSSLFASYDDGSEDHQILVTLHYTSL